MKDDRGQDVSTLEIAGKGKVKPVVLLRRNRSAGRMSRVFGHLHPCARLEYTGFSAVTGRERRFVLWLHSKLFQCFRKMCGNHLGFCHFGPSSDAKFYPNSDVKMIEVVTGDLIIQLDVCQVIHCCSHLKSGPVGRIHYTHQPFRDKYSHCRFIFQMNVPSPCSHVVTRERLPPTGLQGDMRVTCVLPFQCTRT